MLRLFLILTLSLTSFYRPASAEENPGTAVSEEDAEVSSSDREAILWIGGKLPGLYKTEGVWLWDEKMLHETTVSHTDGGREDIKRYSFITDAVVELRGDSKIIGYLYLDPQDPPSGIMVSLMLKKPHNKVSLYWETEEEAFVDTQEYPTASYMGFLPERGEWAKIEIDCSKVGITKSEMEGMVFISRGGKVWWGETIIEGGRYAEEKTQG